MDGEATARVRCDSDTVPASWARHAPALAAHAWDRLVNRTDVWGAYGHAGAFTAPALSDRGRVPLTPDVLARHFRGLPGAVMGLHTTSAEQTSRFGGIDIDRHDDGDTDTPARNLDDARRIVAAARERGVVAVPEDSNGAGGLHLWMLFDHPVPTRDLFAFLTGMLAELGMTHETFPKQPAANKAGNWLRLPGRHHTRPHWSRIAVGGTWATGEDAVRAWLAAPITPAERVPPAPVPRAVRVSPTALFSPGTSAERRIAAYRAKLPTGLRTGQQRSDVAFHFARFLLHACELSDGAALAELEAWNAGNAVPLSAAKLADTIANAHRYNDAPVRSRAYASPFADVPVRRGGADFSGFLR